MRLSSYWCFTTNTRYVFLRNFFKKLADSIIMANDGVTLRVNELIYSI